MQIKRATVDDAHAIGEVHVRSWQAGYKNILDAELLANLSVEQREANWRTMMEASPPYPPLVAEDERRIVGFTGFFRAGMNSELAEDRLGEDIGEIGTLYVHPDHWGRGIGEALLRTAESALVDAGFVEAVLWTFEANERTRRFYEKRGWALDGAKRSLFTADAVRYRRSLAQSSS